MDINATLDSLVGEIISLRDLSNQIISNSSQIFSLLEDFQDPFASTRGNELLWTLPEFKDRAAEYQGVIDFWDGLNGTLDHKHERLREYAEAELSIVQEHVLDMVTKYNTNKNELQTLREQNSSLEQQFDSHEQAMVGIQQALTTGKMIFDYDIAKNHENGYLSSSFYSFNITIRRRLGNFALDLIDGMEEEGFTDYQLMFRNQAEFSNWISNDELPKDEIKRKYPSDSYQEVDFIFQRGSRRVRIDFGNKGNRTKLLSVLNFQADHRFAVEHAMPVLRKLWQLYAN